MKSLFKTVSIITVFSVLTRALGFLLRIWLSRVIGAEELGIYQVAFSVFIVLLTFVSSGLPLILSKMTAGFATQKDKKSEQKLISAGLILAVIVSVVLALFVVFTQKLFGFILADEKAILILLLMLPALLFSAIYAVFRGNFWGHNRFLSTCGSEFFEQLTRIIFFGVFAFGFINLTGASASAVAMTLSCFASCVFVTCLYFCTGGKLKKPNLPDFKALIKTATPITCIRIISSLIQPLIAIIIPARLITYGMQSSEAMSLLGVSMGMTVPFLFIPSALIGSLAMALVPDLSSATVKSDNKHIENRITSSILFSAFISSLFIPLYIGAGEHMGIFFYNNLQSGILLSSSAWIMLPLGLTNITSSILNAVGLETKSLKNYVIGAILMLLSIWFLPKFAGIHALTIGMGLCFLTSCILNILMLQKHFCHNLKIFKTLFGLLAFCLPTAALTYFTINICSHFMPLFFSLAFGCILGVSIFLVLCFMFNIVGISSWWIAWSSKLKYLIKRKKKTA